MGQDRRTFLKTAAALGGVALLRPGRAPASVAGTMASRFGVHPFVEANPDAVFLMRTSVNVKTNAEAKKQAGRAFGNTVFVPLEESGFPVTARVAIKPNLTSRGKWSNKYTVVGSMGVVTDAYFVEGVIEGMKPLGLSGSQFYLREVNSPEDFEDGGYWDMAERTGADLRDLSAEVGVISENDLVWNDLPDGTWFSKIPTLWPVNAAGTMLINIAKFKAHGMGITLCAKNLQGTIAHNYQAHCTAYSSAMDMPSGHIQPDAKSVIRSNYDRHLAAGIPRWDRPGRDFNCGLGMETWASRCLDNNSVTHPDLHVVEGIYGRDGNFMDGPNAGGLAADIMTNLVLFGKNPFHVDIIGHWLAGHEPGNFGLFHLAIERGLSRALNPMDIPVYEWTQEGAAVLTPLGSFERTPLKTYYLQRDYNGQTEPYWHLCDEAFDYGSTRVDLRPSVEVPGSAVLHQNYPNPFNPSTSISFSLPRDGRARVDILNSRGETVDVAFDGPCARGNHLVVWRSGRHPSGTYLVRLRSGAAQCVNKMLLVR
jgi:uncharacterized protein (DUF362 family)